MIWRPLTGKIWWNGGIGLKPSLLSDTLPQEHLDKARLRQAGRRRISNAGEESPSSGKENDKSSEDDWENLEHVKLGSNPSPEEASTQDQMLFTWFGQSTCLVQVEGITLLTDPVFGDKPVESVLAPARLRPPACSLEELLDLDLVDLVLISHDHFDHLDEDVVFALQDKVIWVIPTGLGGFLKARGVSGHRIMEMNWWEERQIVLGSRSITATCTPAQHWSGRTPWAANQTLWCGFIVKGSKTGKSFFHCGDTGYSKGRATLILIIYLLQQLSAIADLFQAIGKQYGPITLAALPIGSYHPRWIMRTVHTDPEGAVGIHRDLKIQKSVAVHHGTWIMSDEDFDEPPKELERQLGIQGIEKQKFVTLPVGRTIAV